MTTRSLVFAGKDFSEFHCWWDGSRVFRKPAKRMDRYTIPFRNGDLFRSQDSFDNVEIVFNCYIKDDYEKNYSDLINWLNSFDNYQKLQNSAEADTFRMAMFHSAVEPETGQFLKDGQFTLTFDCMPQEFLVDGEEEIDASNVFAAYTGSSLTINNAIGQSSVTSTRVYFDPVQDLNGYEYPWVGGAGKNLLDTSRMSTATESGATFARSTDGIITVGGNATATVYRNIGTIDTESGVQYIFSGTPSGGGTGKYRMTVVNIGYDTGNGLTFTGDGNAHNVTLDVYTNYPASGNLVFKPMIRLASENDDTYEPYSNICPITGWSGVKLIRPASKNLLQYTGASFPTRVYFDPVQSGSGDPSPSNIRPIEGWQSLTLEGNETITEVLTGEELLNYSAWQSVGITGGSATWENDGVTLTSNATDCYTNYESSVFPTGARIAVSEGDVLRMTWDVEGTATGQAYIFGNGGTSAMTSADASLGVLEWTVPSGVTYITFRVGVRGNGNTLSYKNISIRKKVTYYGGYVDLVSGVMTLTHGFVTFDGSSDETWGLQTDGRRCAIRLTNCKNVEGIRRTIGALSNLYEEKYPIETWNSVIGFSIEANGYLVVRQFTTNTMTLADFKTFLQSNPMQICYPLQTPTTVQLTENEISLIYGENTFSTDATSLRIVVEEPAEIENPTLMEAQPIIIINGAGTYYLNGDEIIKTHGFAAQYPTYIDTETMDAYALDSYGNKINQNGYVTLTAGLIKLAKGKNYFYQTGRGATIIPRWWKL